MEVETKFLRLFKPAALGDRIDGWRVCWIGSWDNCRVLFVVMVERPRRAAYHRPIRARIEHHGRVAVRPHTLITSDHIPLGIDVVPLRTPMRT